MSALLDTIFENCLMEIRAVHNITVTALLWSAELKVFECIELVMFPVRLLGGPR
jgi:hypothetical protein